MKIISPIITLICILSGSEVLAVNASDRLSQVQQFLDQTCGALVEKLNHQASHGSPAERARATERLHLAEDQAMGLQGAFVNSIASSLGAAAEQRKSQIRMDENSSQAQAYGEQVRKTLGDPQILSKGGLAIVSIIAGYFILKGGAQIITKYIESRISQPRLVQETSISSSVMKYFQSRPKRSLTASDIVLSSTQKREFLDIAKSASASREHGTGFSHLLFYGPPGTGKTLSAKIVSQISGLDYAIIAGSSFKQFEQGKDIQELDKLIRWGNASPNGLVLFIDEADSALGVRNGKDQRADDLVNFFLSNFEKTSHEKIMLIFASNHIEKIDQAVLSRISKVIYVDLPAKSERIKQLEQDMTKVFKATPKQSGLLSFFSLKKAKMAPQVTSAPELTENLDLIGEMTEGFSGRDLFDLAEQFKKAAILNGNHECSLEQARREVKNSREKIETRRQIEAIQTNKGHEYFRPNI